MDGEIGPWSSFKPPEGRVYPKLHPAGMGHPEVVQYQVPDFLDVTATQRLASKKKWLQETLVSTATTPQRKAVVPAKEVILAVALTLAAGEAIDAFILGMVRFQVRSSARFNDLQHTSPSTMKVTSNTVGMADQDGICLPDQNFDCSKAFPFGG